MEMPIVCAIRLKWKEWMLLLNFPPITTMKMTYFWTELWLGTNLGYTFICQKPNMNQCAGLARVTKRLKNSSVKGQQKSFCWLPFENIRESSSLSTLKRDGWMWRCTRKPFAIFGEQFRINWETCSGSILCFFAIMQGHILQKLHKIYCQLSTGMFSHIRHIYPPCSSDFHLFPYLKTELSGKYFTSPATVEDAVRTFFVSGTVLLHWTVQTRHTVQQMSKYRWWLCRKNNVQLLVCKLIYLVVFLIFERAPELTFWMSSALMRKVKIMKFSMYYKEIKENCYNYTCRNSTKWIGLFVLVFDLIIGYSELLMKMLKNVMKRN